MKSSWNNIKQEREKEREKDEAEEYERWERDRAWNKLVKEQI